MRKVLLFLGSPRKNGISYALAKQVASGAKSVGAEVITYDLNDEAIKGCQGCNYCRSHDGCITKDGLASMYDHINEVNGIIATFPIYFNNISSQAKKLIDRSCSLLDENYSPRHPGIKLVSLYTHLEPEESSYKNVIDSTNQIFLDIGFELIDSILGYGMEKSSQIPKELLERAFEAGVQLAK